jgi:hypothetical protein
MAVEVAVVGVVVVQVAVAAVAAVAEVGGLGLCLVASARTVSFRAKPNDLPFHLWRNQSRVHSRPNQLRQKWPDRYIP